MSMEGIGGVIRRKIAQPAKNTEKKNEHLPGIEIFEIKKERYIHSDAHALAAEISAHFGTQHLFFHEGRGRERAESAKVFHVAFENRERETAGQKG